MDSIHHVNAEVKKHDGRGNPSPMTNGEKNGSAADVFSTLMQAVASRSTGIFGVPNIEANLTRIDDSSKSRERDTRDTKTVHKKDDVNDNDKPVSKTRDREDDNSNTNNMKVASKNGSASQNQRQGTRDKDTDTRYIEKNAAHSTDKSVSRTRDKEDKGPDVRNGEAADDTAPNHNSSTIHNSPTIKDAQDNTAQTVTQESGATAYKASSIVVDENAFATESLDKIITKEVSKKESMVTTVESENLPIDGIQTVTESGLVAKNNGQSDLKQFHQSSGTSTQTQRSVDQDTGGKEAAQVESLAIAEGLKKVTLANASEFENIELKEIESATTANPLAEESTDVGLSQLNKTTLSGDQTAPRVDNDATKEQVAQVASRVIAESPTKEAVINPVKSEGSELKVTQATTENITAAKENRARELPQRPQFNDTVSQAQKGIDDTVAKGAVAKTEDQTISTAKDASKSPSTAKVYDNTKAQLTANFQVNKNVQDSTRFQDSGQKSAVDIKSQAGTIVQDHGQKNSLDLRTAAAQEQSQSLSRALANDNKTQIQVTVQGQQGVITKPADLNAPVVYSSSNQTNIPSPASISDTTNAMLFSPRSPAEQVQAPITAVSPAPLAPQPQSQTSQQGGSSAKTSLRADGAAPTLPQPGQTNGSQMQNNTSFSLNAGQSTQTGNETARTSQPTATDKPRTTPQQIIDQIKVKITRASKAGMDRVTIQLKPESLGRIEVKLEMSDDHQVRVTVTANTKETLQILQTDARGLERALNEAGLRTDTNNLHFNLRGDGNSQKANEDQNGAGNDQDNEKSNAAKEEDSLPIYDYSEAARARGGVDTFA